MALRLVGLYFTACWELYALPWDMLWGVVPIPAAARAGIELIFFIITGMGLYFGYVLKTVLITQGCFSYG